MSKSLPYARVFLNDLLGECLARGLGLRERGILFTLLWLQHVDGGSIPANLGELRRRIRDEVKDRDLVAVVSQFFPVTRDGRRANLQHAKAYAEATKAYEASVRRGQITAGKRWGADSTTISQTDSRTYSQTVGSSNGRSQTTSPASSNQEPEPGSTNQSWVGIPRKEEEGPWVRGDAWEPDDDETTDTGAA